MNPFLVGPEVIERLMPQKRPFRMIDRLVKLDGSGIVCQRLISGNEAIFDGHYPELPMWPGVHTIEALAQTVHLMLLLEGIAEARSEPVRNVVRDLQQIGMALRSGKDRGASELAATLAIDSPRWGVLARADVKLTAPVFAGDVLSCLARPGIAFGGLMEFEVEAWTEAGPVAKGRLMVAPRGAPPSATDAGTT